MPSLLRLWEEAGWGTLTGEQWREWYVETPHGECLVSVAVDGRGEVVAQEIFTPSLLNVDGREVRALRFSAPILRAEMRGESLRRRDHPVFGLFKTAMDESSARGFGVIYSLPEYGWLPIFRIAPTFGLARFAEAGYACVSVPFEAARGVRTIVEADGVWAQAVAEFGEEYDELWRSAKESFEFKCGVARRHDWLRFRNGGRIAVEVRDRADGSLVGYTATKKQTGLLADILAREPRELGRVLAATLGWLDSERGRSVPEALTHLKVMQTPVVAPALEGFAVEAVDYRFAFTCCTLDAATLPLEALAPERWHIMPGD